MKPKPYIRGRYAIAANTLINHLKNLEVVAHVGYRVRNRDETLFVYIQSAMRCACRLNGRASRRWSSRIDRPISFDGPIEIGDPNPPVPRKESPMAADTKIAWAHHTWNPWRGCAHATLTDGTPHPGCLNCYAEKMSKRNPAVLGTWGEHGTRTMAAPAYWRLPSKWNGTAQSAGERWRVFCASLADVFEDWQGPIHGSGKDDETLAIDDARSRLLTMDDLRAKVFARIDETPNLDWLLLTKRPEHIDRMWSVVGPGEMAVNVRFGHHGSYRRNVWLMTSISDQRTTDALIPELLKSRDLCPVLGLSLEPLLGPITFRVGQLECQWCERGTYDRLPEPCDGQCPHIKWAIIGCESNGRRVGSLGAFRSEAEWWAGAQSIVDQCSAARIPVFMKQVPIDGTVSHNPDDWSEWARVRDFPEVAHA